MAPFTFLQGSGYVPLRNQDEPEPYRSEASIDSEKHSPAPQSLQINGGLTSKGDEEVVYTPSTSDAHSVRTRFSEDTASESDILLASPPPEYESHECLGSGDAKIDIKDDGPREQLDSDVEDWDQKKPKRCCWGRLRRRREMTKARRIKVFIAKVFFAAVLICMMKFMWNINWRSGIDRYEGGAGCWHGHGRNKDHSPSDPRRKIVEHRKSGSFWGQYPLYDELSLSTDSGSMAIIIDPQPADPKNPLKPARISLKSRSGSISVSFSQLALASDDNGNFNQIKDVIKKSAQSSDPNDTHKATIPARPYELNIETRSGSIVAHVGFSTAAKLSSRSGSIVARLTPLVFPNAPYLENKKSDVSIVTEARTGGTRVTVAEPLIFSTPGSEEPESARLISASAHHYANGHGSVAVTYPYSWAGRVHAESKRTGHIRIGGDGVQVVDGGKAMEGVKSPDQSTPESKKWWGSEGNMDVVLKGKGNGQLEFWVGRH